MSSPDQLDQIHQLLADRSDQLHKLDQLDAPRHEYRIQGRGAMHIIRHDTSNHDKVRVVRHRYLAPGTGRAERTVGAGCTGCQESASL